MGNHTATRARGRSTGGASGASAGKVSSRTSGRSLTDRYMNEHFVYGGVVMRRADIIRELQSLSNSTPQRVSAYLMGMERTQGEHGTKEPLSDPATIATLMPDSAYARAARPALEAQARDGADKRTAGLVTGKESIQQLGPTLAAELGSYPVSRIGDEARLYPYGPANTRARSPEALAARAAERGLRANNPVYRALTDTGEVLARTAAGTRVTLRLRWSSLGLRVFDVIPYGAKHPAHGYNGLLIPNTRLADMMRQLTLAPSARAARTKKTA